MASFEGFAPLRGRLGRGSPRLSGDDLAEIGRIATSSLSLGEVGGQLAEAIRARIPFDQMTIGFVDSEKDALIEGYVFSPDTKGSEPGAVTSLSESVVEAGIAAGAGFVTRDESPEELLKQFPHMRSDLIAGIRSVLAVPLRSNEQVVAAMVLGSTQERAYTGGHLDAAGRIGDVISSSLVNIGAFGALKGESAEAANLAEIGRVAGSASDIAEVYERLFDLAGSLIPFDSVVLTRLDGEAGEGTDLYVGGVQPPGLEAGRRFQLSGTPLETVARDGSAVLESGESTEALETEHPGEAPYISSGLRSILVVPLVAEDRVVSAVAFRATTPGLYSDKERLMAEGIAGQIVGAVSRSAALREMREDLEQARRGLEESAVLSEIASLMGSAPDIEDAYEGLAEQVGRLVEFDQIAVATLDAEARQATLRWVAGPEIPDWGVGKTLDVEGEAFKDLMDTRSGIVATSDSSDDLAVTLPGWSFVVDGGFHSVLTVPATLDDQVVAVFILCSTKANAYEARELSLARRIALQIGWAIGNAGVKERLRVEADQLRDQANDAQAVGEIGRTVFSAGAMADVYGKVADRLREVVTFHRIDVAALDMDGEIFAHVYSEGTKVSSDEERRHEFIGASIVEEAGRRGAPFVIHGGSPEDQPPGFPSLAPGFDAGLRSFLIAPLLSKGESVGVMVLSSTGHGVYAERELGVAGDVASSLAGVMDGTRLRERLRRESDALSRAREAEEAVGEIGRALASAKAIDDVYAVLSQGLGRLIEFERIEVVTVHANGETLTRAFVSGTKVKGGMPGGVEPLAGTIANEAVRSRSAVVEHAESPVELSARFPSLAPSLEAGLQVFMAVPLVSRDVVTGVMVLGSSGPERFTARDVALAETLGVQVAAAIANMPKGREIDNSELAALAEISQTVSSSVDIGEVYDLFAEQVRKIVPFDRISLWTVDLERQNLVAAYASGGDVIDVEKGKVFSLASPAGQALLSEQTGRSAERGPVEELSARFRELLSGGAGLPSVLLVPLVSGDETVGMLSLKSMTPNSYTERHVEMVQMIGQQIAGAVANAQVYIECKQVEAAVRDAVERVDLAVEGAGDGLWDWKIAEDQVWWSQRLTDMLGSESDQGEGSPRGWETLLHPDDHDRVLRALGEHLEHKVRFDLEYRLSTDSGQHRWFNDRGLAIWDQEGKAVRMSGSLRDITGAKEDAIRGYTGPVDLRRPLDAIEGLKQVVLEGSTMAEDADVMAARLSLGSRRLAWLIADLETMAEAMDSELRRSKLDLGAIAKSVARKLRKDYPDRNVTLSVARDLAVSGDEQLLRVMLENLLDNAWKFTRDNPVAKVHLGVTDKDRKKAYYLSDDGVGFDPAQADKMFGLFQRLHSEDDFDGTGIGLATVRHIVHRHGGTVWAEGQPGEGATVYFSF